MEIFSHTGRYSRQDSSLYWASKTLIMLEMATLELVRSIVLLTLRLPSETIHSLGARTLFRFLWISRRTLLIMYKFFYSVWNYQINPYVFKGQINIGSASDERE